MGQQALRAVVVDGDRSLPEDRSVGGQEGPLHGLDGTFHRGPQPLLAHGVEARAILGGQELESGGDADLHLQ